MSFSQSIRVAPRALVMAASLVALLSLSACGGGDDSASLSVGIYVGGQQVGSGQSGATQSIVMSAGESIELDASEPVVWTLDVGTSSFEGFNTSVYYQGVTITETTLSPSRIVLETSAAFLLPSPVPITLTAVSTFDSAIVATVDVLITN